MTYLELAKQDNDLKYMSDERIIEFYCPYTLGLVPFMTDEDLCIYDCKKCWNREVGVFDDEGASKAGDS